MQGSKSNPSWLDIKRTIFTADSLDGPSLLEIAVLSVQSQFSRFSLAFLVSKQMALKIHVKKIKSSLPIVLIRLSLLPVSL